MVKSVGFYIVDSLRYIIELSFVLRSVTFNPLFFILRLKGFSVLHSKRNSLSDRDTFMFQTFPK